MGNYAARGNGLNPNPMPLGSAGGNMFVGPVDTGGAGGLNNTQPEIPQRRRGKRIPEMSPVDVSSPDLVAPPADVPAPVNNTPRMRFGASLGEPTAFLGGGRNFDERGPEGPGSSVPFTPPSTMQPPINPRAAQSGWSRMVRPLAPLNSLAMNLGRR